MKIHCFQHVEFEGPADIAFWAATRGHTLTYTRFYQHEKLPELAEVDFLLVMGGPMGVYDEHYYPWLSEEKNFIRKAMGSGIHVLGICLGAQLIAHCAGAEVRAAPHKEIGWFPVYATRESAEVPWFERWFADGLMCFHWHGDRFELPIGAVDLARTAANDHQAFLLNKRILGLQFHAEVTADALEGFVANGAHELVSSAFIQDATSICSPEQPVQELNVAMHQLLDDFLTQ
ncbi:putative amino transferase [Pedobacter sp. BAL39]|uniref:type 1 glutamine amidotransferase n=1 Tax=Pedobacter sp. BAL39 TaxID=391596 RepID=UPI0001559A46|nr:type 1 glutamine amidotransferase [Pedobacter sp. BAL39]EDM35469.1 putative amino transferase [Pedobacter sp. BAL39]